MPWAAPLPAAARAFALLSGLGLLALLVLAAWLTPDERGLGTHRQLGFPQCTALKLLGIRCPTCGMTTSWAHTVRGQLGRAAAANCGGTLLALSAIAMVPWLLGSGARGQWLISPPSGRVALTLMLTVLGVTLLDWAIRLIR